MDRRIADVCYHSLLSCCPIAVLVNMLSSKITFAIQHSDELMAALKKIVADLEQQFNIEIASDENINKPG